MSMISGPVNIPGGSTASSGRLGDFVVALVGFTVGVPLALLLIVALIYGASYVLVDLIAVKLGLISAWGGLVSINAITAPSAALVGESLILGAVTGSVIGIARVFRRWRKDHHQWIIEALFSSEALNALRLGVACLSLHVTISLLASWLVTLGGVYWPWPTDLGGHGGALIVPGSMIGIGGGSGGGWDPAVFAFAIVFGILLACIFAGIAICMSFSGAALLLMLGDSMLRGGVFGGSLAAAGKLMESTLRVGEGDSLMANAVFTGIFAGAANAAIYIAIVFVGSAMFGIEYLPPN